MLFKKLLRTMGQYKAQFISMIIMIALGFGVFVGANMEWVSIEKNTNRLFEETGLADYKIYSSSAKTGGVTATFSENDLQKIKELDGVKDAARFFSVNADVTLVNGEKIKTEKDGTGKDKIPRAAITVTESESVSFFNVTSGEAYDKAAADKIWVSDKFAEEKEIKVGDTLTFGAVQGVSEPLEFKVAGLVKSGEYMVCVQDSTQLMPDYKMFGYAYITPAAYKKICESAGLPSPLYAQINVRVNNFDDFTKQKFSDAVNAALGKTMFILSKEESSSYALAHGEVEEGQTMGAVLPVLFLAIAVLTMITTMHRIAAKEKTQIGTLKALGYKNKRILAHYSSYALAIGIVGAALGIALGYGIAYIIMNPSGMMGTYMDLPYWKLHMPLFCVAVMIAVLFALTLIGFLSVKSMLRGTAADALRPYAPKKMKNLAIEKTKAWKKFSFGTRWNLRDVMRHKSRTLMSLIGIIGCTVLMAGALGMNDTMNAFLTDYYDKAMNYSSRIYVSSASEETVAEITEKYAADASASVSVEIGDKGVSLDIYDIKHDKVRFLDKKGALVPLRNDGAYLCRRIADEYKLKAGDTFTISPYGTDKEYTLKVNGVIYSSSESVAITNAYAEACGVTGYKTDSLYTSAVKNVLLDDALTKNFEIQDKQSIVESFETFTSLLNLSVTVLIAAAIVLGVVVLYNLGVMSYTERYREMATLKVVGFKDKKIAGLLIGQNMWVTVIGVILGLPLAAGTLGYLVKELASEYEMRVVMGWKTFLISTLLTFCVSLVVSLFVAKKNKKIDMVEALKGAE